MIRSLIRCTRMYKNVLVSQTKYTIPIMHHISEGRKHKSHSIPNLTTEESESIPPNVNHESVARSIRFLHKKLNCTKEQAEEICIAYPDLVGKKFLDTSKNLEFLLAKGVRADVILDNPRILTRNHRQLTLNLTIVKDMKPKDINDFAALVQVSTAKLLKLRKSARSEENVVPKRHRIYFLSDTMNIEPSTITKFISRRLFVLDIPFEMVDQNLRLLLKYIAPMDILHDLWAFRYAPDVIEHRLNEARLGDKKKLMPWMIRCPKEILLNSIKITAAAKAIAGNETTVKYLSDRLKYDVETTESIMQKHPLVYKVRVTRIKEVLDYLLDEAGFSAAAIGQTPRIFCHSLETTKKRLNELKALGCQPKSLSTVCKSANLYNKFVKSWIDKREMLKKKNIIKE